MICSLASTRVALALSLLAAACGPLVLPVAPARTHDVEVAPVRRAAFPLASPPAQAAPPITQLRSLDEPVCNVSAPAWNGDLRLSPGGAPFARVSRGSASIGLGGAAHGGVSVAVLASASLRVLGVVDQPSVYLAKPTLLSRFVVPRAPTAVDWHETTSRDRVVVSIDVSDLFEFPKVAEQVVACDALTGSEPSYDARAHVAPSVQRTASVQGAPYLAAGLGERSVARFILGSARKAEIVSTEGQMSRVVIETPRYVAVGWLGSDTLGNGRFAGVPRVHRGATGGHGGGGPGCAHDIPLIASVAGERAVVGVLPAGRPFAASTLDVEEGFVALELFVSWFQPTSDARMLARARDLEGC